MTHHILVAYFSATGTTERVARRVAELLGADAERIVPEQPYEVADLNWSDKESRSAREMADEDCRPAIRPLQSDLADYDVVFVGYPIWWGVEPRVVDTFLTSYDFTGKILVPFATSGGSGMGSSPARIQALTPGSTVRSSRLLAVDADEQYQSWIDGMRF